MAMKGCSAFPKAPASLEPHHQTFYGHIQDTRWMRVLHLCRGAVSVFYNPSRLGNIFSHTNTHTHTHIYLYIYIYVCVCVCFHLLQGWEIHLEFFSLFGSKNLKDLYPNERKKNTNKQTNKHILKKNLYLMLVGVYRIIIKSWPQNKDEY